jgi:anti-sigma B factor antagonist
MSEDAAVPGRPEFLVHQFEGCAVLRLPAETDSFTAPAISGELCALLDSGMRGLIVDMSDTGLCDAACLGSLVRAARRAQGWGSWIRLVIPDQHARKVARLVSLDGLMPVHGSVAEAVASSRGGHAAEAWR